jgi:DNA-binding transcriptional MerR regulator
MSEYTIQELIEQTVTPRRTIYFYTQQGILPPLQGAGLSARYQQVHLLRLKLIPVLRRQGLRLDQIREYFDGQDESALENRLNEAAPVEPLPKPSSPPTSMQGTFIHYMLPEGMTLLVPAEIAARQPLKVKEIIQTIQEKMGKEKE